MSSLDFGWETLIHTDAPPGCSLEAALLTTYDRPDERLLVEHLLPLLLKVSREPDGEGMERQLFLLELERRLKQLHDKLIVVSSTLRDKAAEASEGESGCYGWIWRSIRHLTVGSRRRAVQHAKLWLLHWRAADGEGTDYLEIVVSSANLTMSAFKGQLQGAWRACVELRSRPADARRHTWGVLPAFLWELATSTGGGGHLDPFVELLARAECPAGVSFVASVPGTYSRSDLRRTPWGAAGLRAVVPPGRGAVTMSILSPYVGSWTTDALEKWCAHFDGAPKRLELVWVDQRHPWARAKRWQLPKATLGALTAARSTLLQFRHTADDQNETDRFHEQHHPADDRWSHAKIYALGRGSSRRVLVTSANFSLSAWGGEGRDGDVTIENFELGVCLENGPWPFDCLSEFDDIGCAATVSDALLRSATVISWAQAEWDGKDVFVECRCEPGLRLDGRVKVGDQWNDVSTWEVSADAHLRSATVPWGDRRRPPSVACFTCEGETVTVAVFDARPAVDRELTTPPEVDDDVVQAMRDQLLFEEYGGRMVTEDTDDVSPAVDGEGRDGDLPDASSAGEKGMAPAADDHDDEEVVGGRVDSYSVPAFVQARNHLNVVDNWAARVKRVAETESAALERQWLRRDGELLVDAFVRLAGREKRAGAGRAIGANMASEEVTLRLKHFPEP